MVSQAGEYYLAVSAAFSYDYSSDSYSLKASYAPGSTEGFESESNDTLETANALSLDKAVMGQLSSYADIDTFKLEALSAGLLTLNFDLSDGSMAVNSVNSLNNVDDTDGCPDEGKVLVNLTSTKIEILDKVFFNSGKATIQNKSFALLDQVGTVLRNHAELTRVRVEGHTDDQGKDDANLTLSQARADAVTQYLVDHGIDAVRLEATGFGETRPAVAAQTGSAREQNRRVEFVIVP